LKKVISLPSQKSLLFSVVFDMNYRIFLFPFCLAVVLTVSAQSSPDSVFASGTLDRKAYLPRVQGTVRAKYEYSLSHSEHRFQVRNARVGISGKVHPMVEYKAEIDLSDEGEIQMLDAYCNFLPFAGLNIAIGQMKIPFSTDNLRSPHQLYFANRSFVGKQMSSGLRDVGITVAYGRSQRLPFKFSAGIYNGSGIYNQRTWKTHLNYAVRAEFLPFSWLNISLNVAGVRPETLQMTLYDAGVYTEFHNIHIEAEYAHKAYQNRTFAPTNAFVGFAEYAVPLKKGIFQRLSLLARYDVMTANSRGIRDEWSNYLINDRHTERITCGATLRMSGEWYTTELRVNYENYLTHNNTGNDDKIVVELMVRF
jgi:hypothetical protein